MKLRKEVRVCRIGWKGELADSKPFPNRAAAEKHLEDMDLDPFLSPTTYTIIDVWTSQEEPEQPHGKRL